MDTVWSLDWSKCSHCYRCIEICTETSIQANDGTLGMLVLDDDGDVTFLGETYGCYCHHCKATIDGEEIKGYTCAKFCPTGAMRIYRE